MSDLSKDANDTAFLERIMRFQDGALNAAEVAVLEQEMKMSPEKRGVFAKVQIQSLSVHEHLRHEAYRVVEPLPGKHWSQSFRWRAVGLAAAAALVLLAGISVWFTARPSGHAVAVEVLGGDAMPQFVVGQRMALRRLVLESGTVQFRLDSGVVVEAAGPAEIELINAMRLRLVAGRVSADVGEHGKGFTIDTVETRVVDLGTKFGVDVSTPGRTDVVVFEGKVEVHEPQEKNRKLMASLTTGEGVSVTALVPKRIAMLNGGARDGDWKAQFKGPPDVIADVHDNVVLPDFHRFYVVTPRGLKEGARAYTDRPNPGWKAQPGEAMPEWLAGADVVRTFHMERHAEDFALTVSLSRPAAVFVFLDLRKPAPPWLANDFKDTGARLRLGPWIPNAVVLESLKTTDGEPGFVTCAVWKREVTAVGDVTLGQRPMSAPGERGQTAMYGIAAKALP